MDQSEEMFKLVRRWRETGLRQGEFCRPNGIIVAKFGFWVGKEKLVEKATGFVRITAVRSATDSAYDVIYPNDVQVNYKGGDLMVLS